MGTLCFEPLSIRSTSLPLLILESQTEGISFRYFDDLFEVSVKMGVDIESHRECFKYSSLERGGV